MLCKPCERIFEGNPPRSEPGGVSTSYSHHSDREVFRSSAATGCRICSALWQCFEDFFVAGQSRWSSEIPNPFTTYAILPQDLSPAEAVKRHSSFLLSFTISSENREASMFIEMTFSILPDRDALESNSNIRIEAENIMSRWLSNCVQNHPECHPRNLDPWFPTRLIDLGPPSSPCVPHLIITEEYATFQSYKGLADMEFANLPVYATLSHCWGKVQPLKLLSSNIQEMKEEIPLISIPKTFTDAFLVAKSLQIRYIWIDSLCIIQDSRADWKKESAMMGRVYGMSYCSIAGTGAIDNSEGLFPRENSIKPEPTGLVIRWDSVPERRYVIVEVADAWRAQFEKLPLNQRAWALQERILANRILHFTKDQLIWECREHVASEEFPTGLPDSLQESHRTRNKLLYSSKSEFPHAWADIIRMYTQAELTFPLDKLIAISGLASEARSRKCVSGRYIAGMWECQLPMSLLWVRGDMHENAYACRRPKQYRAPFWSWASLDCPIDLKWTTAHVLRQSNLTEVKHVHAGSAEYEFNGQAVETFISLCGPLGLFTWKQKSRWHGRGKEIKSYCIATVKNFPVPEQPPMIASTTFPDSVWNDVIFDALEEDHLSDLLWCLPVYLCYGDDAVDSGGPEPRAYGLILDQVKEDHFRRVGAFRICSPDVEALAHLSLHTIVLV